MRLERLKAMVWAVTCVCAMGLSTSPAQAQEATFSVKILTPETALKAAQAALKKCRDEGYQVAVAVVDRSGLTQVVLRDRFSGVHTPRMAVDQD